MLNGILRLFDRRKYSAGVGAIYKKGVLFQPQGLELGDYVYIGPGSYIHAGGGITIGDGTILGSRVEIWSVDHNYLQTDCLPYGEGFQRKNIEIGKGCWLGLSVKVCPGVTIGDGAVVAMGSVVTKPIPEFSVAGGNPAKVIKYRYENEAEFEKLAELVRNSDWYLRRKQAGF